MRNKLTAFILAMLILVQTFVPVEALTNNNALEKKQENNLVKVGELDTKSYPKLDNKTILAIQKQARENQKLVKRENGVRLFSADNPYLPGQNPTDAEKEAAFGNLKVKFKAFGLKENGAEKDFQWNEIFGTDSNGRPGTVDIYFIQKNAKTNSELNRFKLSVDKSGDFILKDLYGNPADLPLYSNTLEPYKYDVELDTGISEKVKLLTVKLSYSGNEQVSQVKRDGKIIYNIPLDLQIAQIASTKFVSEWHTGVVENDRPAVNGDFDTLDGQDLRYFPFPKNNTDVLKLRMESYNLETDDWPGYDPQTPPHLRVIPKVSVDEDMLQDPATYTIDKDAQRITSNGKIYKYDLQYDVINGGKLTMTEIIPVTFDANGGKFASITDATAKQEIKKEVEYDGTLTDKAEDPTKDRETFKGWSTTKDGTSLTEEKFKEAVKNVKEAKTFYAIWDNNDILADQLEVKESFKDGTGYVNDFIPTLDTLKGQVKIKDTNGDPQALANDDTFEILDDSGTAITGDALKDYLYGKLQEKDNPNGEPTRIETVKAKVTHNNSTSQTVDIPIKVIKNIYEAKTLTEKPFYVPKDYVKVTVDPTTKAQDPQKTYYYVNPDAKVVIPGKDPTGKDDYKFIKWTMKADSAADVKGTDYTLADRHQFGEASTITAQYSKDVIPQEGDTKPQGTPDNFVKVTFVPTDKGTMEGAKIFWVNPEKEVTIPVENPVGKQYFTFKEWKIGVNADGDVYTPSTAKKFTEATTITATYTEAKNIIPYNPSEPITRPDGYVRVTFAADPGLKLTEQKAYYVKKNAKDTNGETLTLKAIKDDATKGYPTYEELTGYKFDKWDKEDSLVIETADIVVTAKATKLDNVIPEKDKNNNTNEKPAGYKEVTFVVKTEDATKGSITGVAKFYVNPTEYVTIKPPATKAETGFEFGAWDKDATIPTVYKEDATIIGSFNGLKDLIPKTKTDESEKPNGYKKVEFVIDPSTGGKIADGEVTVYYVNPAKDVTIPQPKTVAETGYIFEKWDQDTVTTAKKYTADITVKGNFKKLEDIIPGKKDDGTPNEKPDGYVTVTFEKGEHGKEITGQTVYYVNPKADPVKTLANIKKPTVTPETGWKQKAGAEAWDTPDNTEIKGLNDIVVKAQYDSIADVVPKTKDDGTGNKQPDGYITVTFEKGANGELEGNTVFYINPNKAVVLEDKAPTIKPNTGYTSAGWDTTINKSIQYKDGDKITALYNKLGDVIPQEKTDGSDKPAGYLTVTFLDGGHGTLSGKTVYYVKPNKEVTVPAPTVKPSTGYEFKDWDQKLTQTFTAENTNITAEYKELDNIIPQKNTDGSDKPEGYHKVTFKPDANGSLSGTTVYYVKPNVEVDLNNTANAITKNPNVGYTIVGGTWDPEITSKEYTGNAEYTFKFNPLDDIIEEKEGQTRPNGYVKVEFVAGDNGSLQGGNKTYYVNPTKNVTVDKLTVPTPQANSGYNFLRWAEKIVENEVITGDKKFEAIFVPLIKYPDKPSPDNPEKPDYPDKPYPWYPNYPNYPDNRPGYSGLRTVYIEKPVEKIVKVPVPVADNYFKEVRYMQGFNGYFRPNDGLTRAEAAQILANALVEDGYKYNPNFKISYKDVGEAWYTRAVKIVTEANVFAGYDDGNFKPQAKITRNEWIATLKRFQELGDASGNNMNLSDNHWAKGEIQAAFNEGWLKIYTDGLATYKGDEFIPRQEVAAVSNRAFKRIVDKTYIGKNNLGLVTYKDVNTSMWAYEDILCASNTFLDRKDRYIAHWVKEDKNQFNIDTSDLKIVQKNFQRNPR